MNLRGEPGEGLFVVERVGTAQGGKLSTFIEPLDVTAQKSKLVVARIE
jgi:hypothetical protein